MEMIVMVFKLAATVFVYTSLWIPVLIAAVLPLILLHALCDKLASLRKREKNDTPKAADYKMHASDYYERYIKGTSHDPVRKNQRKQVSWYDLLL